MNVKQYIDKGFTIIADTNIARVIRIDFPEARTRVHPIEDRYSYAGISTEKILIISDSGFLSVYEGVYGVLHRAEEVAFIKRTKEGDGYNKKYISREKTVDNYRLEMLEKAKDIINNLEEKDFKRITLDLDDSYTSETEITVTIELNKVYDKNHNN